MNKDWNVSNRALKMKSSIIRELLKITSKPGLISFGGGLPDESLFPKQQIADAATRAILEHGDKSLQYGLTDGYPPLRQFISEWMKKKNINVDIENILITVGSQQGLDLCGRVFLDKDDVVLTSTPTYLGALQAFNAYEPQYVSIPSDDDGMLVDDLDNIVKKHKPKLIYQIPTFQNPDGRTLPLDRREKLIEVSEKYNVPIVEDDPYSSLFYYEETPPLLKAMAPENVIFMSTFSKMVSPGFRLAWLSAPKTLHDKFVKMKQGCDLHSSTLAQHILYQFVIDGRLDAHLEIIKKSYKEKLQSMYAAMEKHLPEGVKWTHPTGGMFIWLELPERLDTIKMFQRAVDNLVAYVPGTAFYPNGDGNNMMRLNFSKPSHEEIDEGMKRLGKVIREELAL